MLRVYTLDIEAWAGRAGQQGNQARTNRNRTSKCVFSNALPGQLPLHHPQGIDTWLTATRHLPPEWFQYSLGLNQHGCMSHWAPSLALAC